MKRSHSPSPPLGARKSARMVIDDLKIPPPPSWPLAGLALISEDLKLDDGRHACEVYNHLRSFARRSAPDAVSRRHAALMAETVREVSEIVQMTRDRLKEKFFELESLASEFSSVVLSVPDSYEDGDLLSLTSSELEYTLNNIQVSNADRLAAYVLRLLPEAFSKKPPSDEEMHDGVEPKGDFADKVFALLQHIISRDLDVETFHALVLLKSLVHDRSPRVASINCLGAHASAHARIDTLIRRFVDSPQKIVGIGEDSNTNQRNDSTDYVKDSNSRLTWRIRHGNTSLGFWDFAAAARTLRSAYDTFHGLRGDCTPDIEYGPSSQDFEDVVFTPCFHQNSIRLLDWLLKKAWSEIHTKILLTAGILLTAELTERIFKDALEAEEIPNEPSVIDGYLAPRSHFKVYWLVSKIEDEDVCSRIQEPRQANHISFRRLR